MEFYGLSMEKKIELTPKQKKIVEGKGKFVVKACPGSGKTFTIAARIANLLSERQNDYLAIAALSFTNVACSEIQHKLETNFNIKTPLPWPHFIGTIDSFINNYIFLPFGHLIMGCQGRPELVGAPVSYWSEYDIMLRKYYKSGSEWKISVRDPNEYFDKVTFNKEDEIIPIYSMDFFPFSWGKIRKKDGNYRKDVEEIINTKKVILKEGKAIQADANYVSLKVLSKYERILKNLSNRFSHFMIDEAQDTTDVQMEIVNLLENNGANELVLIGDPNQAIFEWNTAKPELFEKKYSEWDNSADYEINENHRSSKLICKCTNKLLEIAENNSVNNGVKDYPFKPQIVIHKEGYDKKIITEIVNAFLKSCSENNITISQDNVAILYRSHSVGEWLEIPNPSKRETPWKNGNYFVRDIVYGKYLIDNYTFDKGFNNVERGYHKYSYGNKTDVSKKYIDTEIEKVGYKEYRNNLFKFFDLLPTTKNIKLNEWIFNTNKLLLQNQFSSKLVVENNKANITIDELFGNSMKVKEFNYYVGTIHSAKGKTFEAVLLLLSKHAGSSQYKNILFPQRNKALSEFQREELRNIYVAITRPRKILMLAVPETDEVIWKEKFGLT